MKKLIVPVVLAGFVLGLLTVPGIAQDQKPAAQKQAASRVIIPKEVKDVLNAGLAAKQARLDIPFTIFQSTFLPAQQAFYEVFFIKMKNADLGFAAPPASPVGDAAAAGAKLKTTLHVFLDFHKVENGVAGPSLREVYVPVSEERDAPAADKQAEFMAKEEWYSVGYSLMPGDYCAAIAVASQDLKKIGVQYYDFKLPDPKTLTKALDTTPVFFVKDLKNVGQVEQRPLLHPGMFRYSVLEIIPNIDRVFTAGDSLDVFFTILGAQQTPDGKSSIEVVYEVTKGEEPAIKFAPATYDAPLVSHPLPLKQTVQIKTGTDVRQDVRDLAPGAYTLHMKITDVLTRKDKDPGISCNKQIDFTVK